jgi:hypothetical protein
MAERARDGADPGTCRIMPAQEKYGGRLPPGPALPAPVTDEEGFL